MKNSLRLVLVSLLSQAVKLAGSVFEVWAWNGIILQAEATQCQPKHGLVSLQLHVVRQSKHPKELSSSLWPARAPWHDTDPAWTCAKSSIKPVLSSSSVSAPCRNASPSLSWMCKHGQEWLMRKRMQRQSASQQPCNSNMSTWRSVQGHKPTWGAQHSENALYSLTMKNCWSSCE